MCNQACPQVSPRTLTSVSQSALWLERKFAFTDSVLLKERLKAYRYLHANLQEQKLSQKSISRRRKRICSCIVRGLQRSLLVYPCITGGFDICEL